MQHYDQRPFDETMYVALNANGDVKNRQKDAKRLRWRSHQTRFDFSCLCDAGHTVDPSELFAMRQNNRTDNHINVCAIYGIQFAPMNCLILGSATETVSQIKICVIYDIQFIRTNYFRLGNTTETVQLNKICVICGIQFT